VQRQIDSQGGAIAFVDDFTAWLTGPTARSNREGIEAIIKQALDWERRSGATFEAEKTAIIHFPLRPTNWNRNLLPSKDKPLSRKRRSRSWEF
jgi:hypothetical protein